MAAGRYNFTIEQGATFTRIFKYKDATGSAIDLSEATAIRMHIRKNIDDNSPITGGSFELGSGFTRSTPAGGSVQNEITLLIKFFSRIIFFNLLCISSLETMMTEGSQSSIKYL